MNHISHSLFDYSGIELLQNDSTSVSILRNGSINQSPVTNALKFDFKSRFNLGKFVFTRFTEVEEVKITDDGTKGNNIFFVEKISGSYHLFLNLTKIYPPDRNGKKINVKVQIKAKKQWSLFNMFSRNFNNAITLEIPLSYTELDVLMVFAKLGNGDYERCKNGKNLYLYSHERLKTSKCTIAFVNYERANKGHAYIHDFLNLDETQVVPSNLNINLSPEQKHRWILGEDGDKGVIDFQVDRKKLNQDFILFNVDTDMYRFNKLSVVKFPLRFNYTIGSNSGEFKSNIYIQEEGKSTWLAVDVGTSAISGMIDESTLNLHQGLRRLKGRDYKESSFLEKSPYLSSTTMLRNKGFVYSKNYDNTLVQISPSNSEILEDTPHLLPPLKMLVGTKHLENSRGTYNIDYSISSDLKDAITVEEEKNWIEVENLLISFFISLFRDFIQEDEYVKEKKDLVKVNKIVFTIPNSFSVNERAEIRKTLTNNFTFLKQIIFLSESDACACFYLKNWIALNDKFGRNDDQINNLRPPKGEKGEEYVLIYDMGAGTLDITYLKVTSQSGDIYVEMLGNFSSTSAGNYADYVISEALIKYYKSNLIDVFDNDKTETSYHQGNRFMIKEFVKNELKPSLSLKGNKELNLKVNDGSSEFEINIQLPLDINHPINESIDDYIRLNTSDVFGHFFSLHGNGFKNKVDTMIFAGRATQLIGLKEELKHSIYDYVSNNRIVFMDLMDDLKLAPAKGAMFFAGTYLNTTLYKGSKNINARYGFVTQNNRGKWEFTELLNPNTKPLNSNCLNKEGMRIYEYFVEGEINVTHSNEFIYFVKSYSKFTSEDFTQDGYVHVIYSFTKDDALILGDKLGNRIHNPSQLPVSVKVTTDNTVIVKVGNKELASEDMPEGGFVINETFRKSIWPHYI